MFQAFCSHELSLYCNNATTYEDEVSIWEEVSLREAIDFTTWAIDASTLLSDKLFGDVALEFEILRELD